MSPYQPYESNSYSYDNALWDQGYPHYRTPSPYDAGFPPISDDGYAEGPEYDTPYPEKPPWSMTARRANFRGFAPMRPGRAAPYPGSDGGRWQNPGLASGFGWGSRCPQCGKTNPTTDEREWDGWDGPSSYYYANVTGYPYGSTPTQTQQQSRYSCCPFCGQTWSMATTAYHQQYAGTGRALALAPAQSEDGHYDTGDYGPSFPGPYSREEWHTGSPGAPHTQFYDTNMAYQEPYSPPYSPMGTGPYGHYWQQRHHGPYSPPPSGAPYDFQSPYYSTMDAYDRTNQGIPVGGYPYGLQSMGMSGAARRTWQTSYQYSSLYVTRSTGGMGMGSSPYGSEYGGSDGW